MQILTHHEPSPRATPGLPARVYTFPEPDSVEEMQEEIRAARKECDVLFVALHKGMVHTHAELQMYEKPLAHAAIDAGADAVIGHHAHILRGIEVYRGKPIYHNLGNFVCVTHALTPTGDNNSPERLRWIAQRKKLFGFTPDPDMPFYAFNPESRKTMLARMEITKEGVSEFRICSVLYQQKGAPEVLTDL
ncbi:MAG: CapA family protein [Clostridium sp.]